MALCFLGIHSWDGCRCSKCGKTRDAEHVWDGCTCPKCLRTRDAEHAWDGCKCSKCAISREHEWDGCKCSRCGKTRDAEHTWNGCKCSTCGKTRDAEHTWNGCKCSTCGTTRAHEWDGCKCSRCGKTLDTAATDKLLAKLEECRRDPSARRKPAAEIISKLGKLGDPRSKQSIRAWLSVDIARHVKHLDIVGYCSYSDLLEAVIKALVELQDTDAVPPLLILLKDLPIRLHCGNSMFVSVQKEIVHAVTRLGAGRREVADSLKAVQATLSNVSLDDLRKLMFGHSPEAMQSEASMKIAKDVKENLDTVAQEIASALARI